MIFGVITIFPEMFATLCQYGVVGRATENNLFQLSAFNPRDFATDNYRRIDDKTFGGGPGMVMKVEPLEKALTEAKKAQLEFGIVNPQVIYLSPQGVKVDQALINQLATTDGLIFVCGRYEGIDERFIERNVTMELSLGDFVVSGGELPAMLLIDAIARHLPGVLNKEESALNDSFMDGLLDCPHYTHPRVYQESEEVPAVLLSGDHEKIRKWRLQQSLWRTYLRRPELLKQRKLTKEESRLLKEMLDYN